MTTLLRFGIVLCIVAVAFATAAQQSDLPATTATPAEDLHLDETGFATWRFLNPVAPFQLDGKDLEIINDTGDRTFVVTIPYVYRNDELANAYSAAHVLRGSVPLQDVVCRALTISSDPRNHCQNATREALKALETLKIFRDVIKEVKPPTEPPAKLCNIFTRPLQAKESELACHVETLYWAATSGFDWRPDNPNSDVRNVLTLATSDDKQRRLDPAVDAEAARYVARLFNDPVDAESEVRSHCCGMDPLPDTPVSEEEAERLVGEVTCRRDLATSIFDPLLREDRADDQEVAAARTFQQWLDAKELGKVSCDELRAKLEEKKRAIEAIRASKATPPQPASEGAAAGALKSTPIADFVAGKPLEHARQQFLRTPFRVAARELTEAIDTEIRTISADLRTPKDANNQKLLSVLQATRAEVQAHLNARDESRVRAAQCHIRNLEAAARLMASYDAGALVPYRDVPETLYTSDPDRQCQPLTAPAAVEAAKAWRANVQEVARRYDAQQEARETREAQVEIVDCRPEADRTTCTASAVIPPNHRTRFHGAFLRRSPDPRIRISVVYFDDTEPPANANAYVIWQKDDPKNLRTLGRPKGDYRWFFGVDGATGYDLPKGFQGHTRHTSETASVSMQYTGPVEVSATLRFKEGDFGGAKSTNEIAATQYQAKIFGAGGWTLQLGRMTFAQPSAGIALSEKGEGVRAAWGPIAGAYMIRRESDAPDERADRSDDDADVLLFQASVPMPPLRQFLVSLAYGEEKRDQPVTREVSPGVNQVFVPVPYRYLTYGADLRAPAGPLVLGLAGYQSKRRVYSHELLAQRGTLENPGDGSGAVFLATVTWNRTAPPNLIDPPSKTNPAYAYTLFLGQGSGNDPHTTDRDEGYIGEKAGYANDLVFLKQIAADELYAKKIGRGLANKRYAGFQYSDARFSPLAWVAELFRAKEDIVSRATILSAHYYRFTRPINEHRFAALELDAEMKLEAPKNIRWFVRGGWVRTSTALENLGLPPRLAQNPWLVSAGVSIALDGRS